MFRFENSDILYLLFALPLLIIGYFILAGINRRNLRKFGDPQILSDLMPMVSVGRKNLKFFLLVFVLFFLIIALARPQFGSKLEEVKRKGIEIIIALDVSNSMWAEDIKPNRLERAKQSIATLLSKMKNDKIGLIVFAGDAYTQIPITTDYVSAKMFLSNTNPDIVSKQGTALGAAIRLATNSFTQNEEASKVIVLISDGEDHEDNAIQAAEAAAEKGIKIYTIGMGSVEGSPIPLRNGRGFVKDRQNNVVITRMNPKMLNEIAQIGGGKYITATTGSIGLNKFYNELNKLDKAELETKVYSEYNDQYQYFLAMAILLLIIDFFILERKNPLLMNIKIFK